MDSPSGPRSSHPICLTASDLVQGMRFGQGKTARLARGLPADYFPEYRKGFVLERIRTDAVLCDELSNAFTKLARYESNIERALFGALQELQRLQSARLDDQQADTAPPEAPDQSKGMTAPNPDGPPF
jgi:hypothetical protein